MDEAELVQLFIVLTAWVALSEFSDEFTGISRACLWSYPSSGNCLLMGSSDLVLGLPSLSSEKHRSRLASFILEKLMCLVYGSVHGTSSAWTSGRSKNSTEVHPSNSTDQTDRAVYRIDPRSSRMEFRLEPRSDDRTDRTRARLSRPSRHSKNNSRARISLGRAKPEDIHGFSPVGPSGQSHRSLYRYRCASIRFG
ncbi:hypothetical protein F2Q69_00061899 [Brassica cretica]|uniref:DUF4005 domain-containing protein n=1 Tax=Brassica cretica TaxID=69181 RepID=A0A8S9RE90_BRACR|nr:hypothetical protein F2Q69_00061899 [Brassica cretica]